MGDWQPKLQHWAGLIASGRADDFKETALLQDFLKLQHNLYGVDLNAEAVQICQLSLWIKTAARREGLTSFDHTICEGDRFISDLAVHPKAFDWQAAFPEVFAQGRGPNVARLTHWARGRCLVQLIRSEPDPGASVPSPGPEMAQSEHFDVRHSRENPAGQLTEVVPAAASSGTG